MDVILSKVLPLFVYPVGLCIGLLTFSGISIRFGRKKIGALFGIIAVGQLWLASSPFVADWLYASLERLYPLLPIASIPNADAIVVLGGAVGGTIPPRIFPDLNDAADRILYGARLYRAGKAPAVIASGGATSWLGASMPESIAIADLLNEWGVSKSAIIQETQSRNTRENAIDVKRIMDAKGFKRALLVTSASHMPRALAAFRKVGMDVIAAPTDVRVVDKKFTLMDWLPEAGALDRFTTAMKEYIGMGYYWVRGWV